MADIRIAGASPCRPASIPIPDSLGRKGTKMKYIAPPTLALLVSLTFAITGFAQESIPWIQDLSEARQLAEQQQRLVLLHFWGDGCQPCQQLESTVFNQPELIRVVSMNFIPVKIHVQQQPAIANHYKIRQIPTDVVVLPSGAEVYRTVSPAKANAYIAMLDQVRASALSNGLQELNRVASTANHTARNTIDQFKSSLPALPPRSSNEEPLTQSVNSDLSTGTTSTGNNPPAWRNVPVGVSSLDTARNAVVNNEFVGPLDREPQNKPAPGISRYGNPYLNEQAASPAAPPHGNVAATAPPANPNATSPATDPNLALRNAPNEAVPPASQPPFNPTTSTGTATKPAVPNSTMAPLTQASAATNPVAPQRSWEPAMTNAPNGTAAPNPAQLANRPPQVAPQLPPNTPPLALDGYCPVTLLTQQRWEPGNPQFGAIHRGRTYFFKSQLERDRFLSPGAADQFAPVLSGYDPVRFAELRQSVAGAREHGVVYQNQIYLFADEQALTQFEQQPERYVNVVRQAMSTARQAPPQR